MSDNLYEMGAERPPLPPMKPLLDDRSLLIAAFLIGGILFLWKLYVGLIASVIWEEGHFAVSGQYLALGYPDIPAGFPWLARLITSVFGWHVLPLRIVALLISMCMPPAVYFMATPVVSKRNALWAAILALLLPPISLNGTIFYPEGALQVLLALMLGCLLRALIDGQWKWWLLAGLCAAIGLLVHFRFLVPGLGVVIFLLATPRGRAQWQKPGVWITAAIGFLGMLPALIYNAREGWPAVAFHVLNRPDFDPNLRHIGSFLGQQMAIATPVFFVFLALAAWTSLRADRDKPAALLGYQAAAIFLFFGIQSFYNKQIMPHWPFMAYVPLLPYLPGLFIAFAEKASTPARADAARNGDRVGAGPGPSCLA
ncbi:MAG: glycosyltransferase family 39 protein [Asticcacaulis sp.]